VLTSGDVTYYFDVTSYTTSYTAVTPAPAALPLFLTAIGGLGALSRYRRVRARKLRVPPITP
jgi:hypothetical protein